MDSNISFPLFGFWGLISNFQLEITFIYSLSLFTFPKECNLLSRMCHFLSLLVCSYVEIKLAHFKYWNYICFWCSGPYRILQTHCFLWYFLRQQFLSSFISATFITFAVRFLFCLNTDRQRRHFCVLSKRVSSSQMYAGKISSLHSHKYNINI